jgi:hypothetical protein
MLNAAQRHFPQITYTGYDVFEGGDEILDLQELNGKCRVTESDTLKTIVSSCPNAVIKLVKGNTRQTLTKKVKADLAYIDGGHSVETIENDFAACSDCPVIILDDYYFDLIPDADVNLNQHGCNQLIDRLLAESNSRKIIGTFPCFDHFDHLGSITMAFVVDAHYADSLVRPRLSDRYFCPPTKEQLIDAVYKGLLGRTPDKRGAELWHARLEERSIELMLRDFVNTDEFARRYKKINAVAPTDKSI